MNKIYICLLILISMLASCKKEYTHNATILRAETLMNSNAEKSYKLLQTIKHPEKLSQCDYAAWCLHYTHTQFKLQNPLPSDSLIHIALNYYKGSDLYKYEGLSYFLLGYATENQNKFDETMEAYLHAEEKLLVAKEYNLVALTYYRMGKLNRLDENYPLAIENFRKSKLNFYKARNYKNEAYAYREIANTMLITNCCLDSIIYYLSKAQMQALQAQDTANFYDSSYFLGITLLDKNLDYTKAKNLILGAYKYNNYSSFYFNKLAIAYAKLQMADSAMYYYHKALMDTAETYTHNKTSIFIQDSATIYNKENAYLAGVYAERLNGNYTQALQNFYLYQKYHYKTFDAKRNSTLDKINKKYNLAEKNSENTALKNANQNRVIYILILLGIIILIRIKYRITQIGKKKEQLRAKIENDKLQFEIDNKRMLLLSKVQNKIDGIIRFEHIKHKLANEGGLHNGYLREISKHYTLTKEEWQIYIDDVNVIYSHYIDNLTQRFPTISETDKIVIALIALKIDITNICAILDMTKNTLYRRRNTIKERLHIGTTCDLDKWILNNIEEHQKAQKYKSYN